MLLRMPRRQVGRTVRCDTHAGRGPLTSTASSRLPCDRMSVSAARCGVGCLQGRARERARTGRARHKFRMRDATTSHSFQGRLSRERAHLTLSANQRIDHSPRNKKVARHNAVGGER